MKRHAAIAVLLLAGCNAPDSADRAKPGGVAEAKSAGQAKRWDATDACAVFDKAAMSAALGAPVSEASVGLVHQPSGSEAATSECSYVFADGGRASLMLRWSPIADNNAAAIAGTRNTLEQTMNAFGGGTIADVAGLGKAAFWVERTSTLNVFIDEASFAIITLPSGAQSKDRAIAIARKLGA